MNIKDFLELAIILGSITSAIFKFAHLEAKIYERIASVDNKLQLHMTECEGDRQMYEYRLNATDKALEHKFNRLANWIKQLAGFLHKESGFQIRDDQY